MTLIKGKAIRFFIYCLMLLFILPACARSKSLYEQKRSLMILDVTEQPRNKKALRNSKKRHRTNKKRAKLKKRNYSRYRK